jgi:MEMO1 family protein
MIPSRTPVASGTFYPALPGRLRADVKGYLASTAPPRHTAALLAPHAGFVYSGPTAGTVFAAAQVPATVIILAPNHTGRRTSTEGGSILLTRRYRTPLGDVEPDVPVGEALLDWAEGLIEEDLIAHAEEHAIEVVLPFLQLRNPSVRIVPLVIAWNDWDRSARLAATLYRAVGRREDVLVVASSDMNHYESADVTAEKDAHALEHIVALDGEGLLAVAEREGISMCGRVPAAVACEYARLRTGGTGEGAVVAYSHSGLANRRLDQVVGYAGVLIGVA